MTELKLLIAEDEAPQRAALVTMLEELWPAARIVAVCADGLEALEAFEREAPEVAFLDIQMPGRSGLDLARLYAERTHIVFVTAFDDYAIRAFEHGATDYLLKPVQRQRLLETVKRLETRVRSRPPALDELVTRLKAELAAAPRREALKWITASLGESVKLYAIDEVLAFRAQDKYTLVITASDEALIRKSLRELIEALDPDEFWQVHRSVVVRAAAVEQIKRDELGKPWLVLRGRTDLLPVSAAFHARFRGM